MIKEFLMRQMLKRQMKGVPEAEQEKIIALVQKNPAFFEQVAKEVQAEVGKGKSQMDATMEVMKRHQATVQELMKN